MIRSINTSTQDIITQSITTKNIIILSINTIGTT
jgi:hypothetical protein